jgi:hypothetical protein
MATKVLTAREHYATDSHTVVRQTERDQETTLYIRRIVRDGAEQLQIEICIASIGMKRNSQANASFCCDAAVADQIAAACANQRK